VVPSRSRSRFPAFSRTTVVAAVLTAVALLGATGIVAGYLIQRNDDNSAPVVMPGTATVGVAPSKAPAIGGFSPVECSGPAPSGAPQTPQKNASREVDGLVLYPGWSFFSNGTGFHMPVPDHWTYQKVGTTYCFRDPDGGRVMTLDTGRKPTADPVQACRKEAQRLVAAGALPGYHLIGLEPLQLLNRAASWEYQYTGPDDTLMHVQTRWFATNGKAYAISWQSRDVDWSGDLPKLNMALSTFYSNGK
jgi:eukaryotic-like serine/threonine-protein kinase